MARCFVTGANGFVGRHLLALLLERGDTVTGLVRATSDITPLSPLFDRHGDRLRLVVGDLRDPDSLEPGLEGTEYVFHLGAVLLGLSEAEFRDTIVGGTHNLLAAVGAHAGPTLRRFLYTSSLAAAGPSQNGLLDEAMPCRPVSWYGTAKRDAEDIVRAAGLPFTIVRPSAVYGEGEQDLRRGTFPVINAGFQPRVGLHGGTASFVYVGDLVRGMADAVAGPRAEGRTYFLCDPQPYTTKELDGRIADALGKRVRIPLPTPVPALQAGAAVAEYMHVFTRERPVTTLDKVKELRRRSWAASPAAAERDFGWRAETPLADGLAREVADWNAERRRDREMPGLPRGERALMTYTLSTLVGIVLESLARNGNWYAFSPRWLIFVVIFLVIGGVMGTVTFLTVRWPGWAQFAAGAAVGVGTELLNVWVLHAWTFNPGGIGGLIPNAVTRAIVVGLPAGIMPVAITAIVRALYRRRLRLG